MKKRIALIILISTMLCIAFSFGASAYTIKSGQCGDNVTYTLDSNYNLFVNGSGDMWDYSSGEAPWSAYASYIGQVTIQQGVTSVGDYSFEDFTSLTNLTLSRTVTNIGYAAFENCSKLYNLSIPSSVSVIEGWAFHACISLEVVTIPSSVTEIGSCAFLDCDKLSAIHVNQNNLVYSSDTNGVLYNKDKTILYVCPRELKSMSIPSTVKIIAMYAFEDCYHLKSITIPSSVEVIEYRAFKHCLNLSTVSLGSGIKEIQSEAFYQTKLYDNSNNWQNGVLYVSNWLVEATSYVTGFYTV